MNPEAIAAEILRLHRSGEPLNIPSVKRRHPDLLAAAYACRPFLGWKQAVELAGLRYQDLKAELLTEVECLICGGYYISLAMHLKKHGTSGEEYRMSFPGAPIVSEQSVADRLPMKENPELPHWEAVLTWEYVLDRTWEWYSREGGCNFHLIQFKDPAVSNTVNNRRWPWDDVIRGLGLDPADERKIILHTVLSKAEVLEALRARAKQGLSVSSDDVRAHAPGLHSYIGKHFLLYSRALVQAGLPVSLRLPTPDFQEKYPGPEAVWAGLTARSEKGLSMDLESITGDDYPLRYAISWHFDTYEQCLELGKLEKLFGKAPPLRKRRPDNPYTTPEALIEALHLHHQRGGSLLQDKTDTSLRTAAFRHFQTWSLAIKAAGLTEAARKQRRPGSTKRAAYKSAGEVVAALRELSSAGRIPSMIQFSSAHKKLHTAIYRYFPNSQSAMEAAGIYQEFLRQHPKAGMRFPDPSSVLQYLRDRHAGGEVMDSRAILLVPHLKSRIYKYFGGLPAALKAAGIYEEYLTRIAGNSHAKYPGREDLLAALRQRDLAGKALLSGAIAKDDRPLYFGMRKHFGGVRPAIIAAGLGDKYDEASPPVPKYPDKESVISALRTRFAEDANLTFISLRKADPPLFKACRAFFGGFPAAIEAAGLREEYEKRSPSSIRGFYPDKEALIAALRERAAADPASAPTVGKRYFDNRTGYAAQKYFGGIRPALQAAGLLEQYQEEIRAAASRNMRERQARFKNAGEVITALHERHGNGLPLTIKSLDPPFKSAIHFYFGSHASALEAAGLLPKHRGQRRRPPRDKKPRQAVYATLEEVIAALQKRVANGKGIRQPDVISDDNPLKSAIYRLFGTWSAAIVSAGLDHAYQESRKNNVRVDAVYKTSDEVIAALRLRHENHLGISSHQVDREDKPLHAAVYRCFKSWAPAIEAAGLTDILIASRYQTNRGRYPSRESVIAALLARHRNGQSLIHADITKTDGRLRYSVYQHFDTYEQALIAAGLYEIHLQQNPRAIRRFRDRQSVVEFLRQTIPPEERHTFRQIPAVPGLKSAVYRLFGSWPAVREAAFSGDGE